MSKPPCAAAGEPGFIPKVGMYVLALSSSCPLRLYAVQWISCIDIIKHHSFRMKGSASLIIQMSSVKKRQENHFKACKTSGLLIWELILALYWFLSRRYTSCPLVLCLNFWSFMSLLGPVDSWSFLILILFVLSALCCVCFSLWRGLFTYSFITLTALIIWFYFHHWVLYFESHNAQK